MAGDLFLKDAAGTFTLEANGGSISSGSAVQANDVDLDVHTGGLTNAVENEDFSFELVCQWATITSIVAGTVAAELYLLLSVDRTNWPDIDTTATTSVLPANALKGFFVCTKAPTANTNMRFTIEGIILRPWLYRAYLIGRAGQTISAGWTLIGRGSRRQYT